MKTVFFTLFGSNVFHNFLLIPNSVIRQLAERPDITTVVFGAADSSFAEAIRAHDLGERVVFEAVPDRPTRTRLGRLFYFFYSYLVFTDTTRLLATFGTRADQPPAGASRWLTFVKALLANTFGRSRFVKTRLTPWLYKKIFASRPYRSVFDRYQPDAVFLANVAFSHDVEFLAEAQRRGIPTLAMPSNWDHLNKYFIPLQSDLLLVQNEPMRVEAIALQGYRPERVKIVGFPRFDPYVRFLNDRSALTPRERFLADCGFAPGSKVILFISGSVYFLDEPDVLRALKGWLDAGSFGVPVGLMVRPYPGKRQNKETYAEFIDQPGIWFNWKDFWNNFDNIVEFLNMLAHADVIISIFSTTAIEAAIFDTPVITLGFDGSHARPPHQSVKRLEALTHFRHVLATGGVKVARSFAELFSLIDGYFKDPGRDAAEREQIRRRLGYKLDGQASRRVVEAILNTLYA